MPVGVRYRTIANIAGRELRSIKASVGARSRHLHLSRATKHRPTAKFISAAGVNTKAYSAKSASGEVEPLLSDKSIAAIDKNAAPRDRVSRPVYRTIFP